MSIFQCEKCGCAENTATGWYHSRFSKRLAPPEIMGQALCSACAPQKFASGQVNKMFNGEWHGHFKRTFLPHGKFHTNRQGNIEHTETGLVGNKAYEVYGREDEHE
jgi:hypothetical protein